MLIYAEVLPKNLGRAMYRINKAMRKYAPDWVTFTDDKNKAEFQILDIIGTGSLEYLYKKDNFAVLQHCFLTAESASQDTWMPVFGRAKLVATYMDLPRLLETNDFNFHRMPWGADSEVFFRSEDTEKVYSVLTTGHVSSTESVNEIYDALDLTCGEIVHIGHDFKLGPRFKHFENISDESMNNLYNKSFYVSGLRKVEGFELPILEGLLCGARGICYNSEHYSHWFGNLVEYIEEDNSEGSYSTKTKNQLEELFSKPPRAVTNEEIELVKTKFSWQTIFEKFWKELENAL